MSLLTKSRMVQHMRLGHTICLPGVYDVETSALLGAGESMMLDYKDLLPGMSMTRAVATQYYAKGAKCEVTMFDEVHHDLDEPTMLRYALVAFIFNWQLC